MENHSIETAESLDISKPFDSMKELRDFIKMNSLINHSPYYLKYSTQKRLEARCVSEKSTIEGRTACDFLLTAYKKKDGYVYIAKAQLNHSPWCTASKTGSSQAVKAASTPFLANFQTVTPRDIVNIIRNEYGTETKYWNAWNALRLHNMDNQLNDDNSFLLINDYLNKFTAKNPETTLAMQLNSDNTFKRLFLCPGAFAKS